MDDNERLRNCRYHVPHFCKGIKGQDGTVSFENKMLDVCSNDSNDEFFSPYYEYYVDKMVYSSVTLSRQGKIIEEIEEDGKWEKLKVICSKDCNKCVHYKSLFIEFPLTINSMKIEEIDMNDVLGASRIGRPCAVRPCKNKKTYLGIYLGDQPLHITASYNSDNGELKIYPIGNPAIYVPSLKKIVRGASSWWKFIESKAELSDITDKDISNQFYVKLAKKYFWRR